LPFDDIAALMGRSCRQPIVYRPQTMRQAIESRATLPASDAERAGWVSSYAAVAAGELDLVTTDIAALTGTPAMTLTAWLRAYPFSLMHVGALL
jgi:NAD(P)H dehydrogenase (quinone)